MIEWHWDWTVHDQDNVPRCESVSPVTKMRCDLREGHKEHGVRLHASGMGRWTG